LIQYWLCVSKKALLTRNLGAELAINSILGAYYLKNFPKLGQTGTGRWAAMFGLLNVVFRPLGGIVSDLIYKKSSTVWSKKIWLHSLAIICGAFQIAIGVLDSKSHATMFGLVAGMAFFLEAGNGANFSLVPHVHPYANGIISGVTGAAGNLGKCTYIPDCFISQHGRTLALEASRSFYYI